MNRRNLLKMLGGVVLLQSVIKAKKVDSYLVEEDVSADREMKIINKNKMTKSEKMHSPTIKVHDDSIDKRGTIKVEVSVGSYGLIHKTTKKHWISEIKLYSKGKLVAESILKGSLTRGYLAVRVSERALGDLEAVAVCNMHGKWRTHMKKENNKWITTRV